MGLKKNKGWIIQSHFRIPYYLFLACLIILLIILIFIGVHNNLHQLFCEKILYWVKKIPQVCVVNLSVNALYRFEIIKTLRMKCMGLKNWGHNFFKRFRVGWSSLAAVSISAVAIRAGAEEKKTHLSTRAPVSRLNFIRVESEFASTRQQQHCWQLILIREQL